MKKHHQLDITPEIREKLREHKVFRWRKIKVRKESYDTFLKNISTGGGYAHLTDAQQKALAVSACLTHPDHRGKHRIFWPYVALAVALVLLTASLARCQSVPSQISIIQFQDSGGNPIKSFVAPFKIKCDTNLTCSASGSTLTMQSAAGGGGGGYSTIQNAAVAIAQRSVINFLGALACVDNAGNLSSDCKLTANAAVANQYLTGVDASGNFLRKQIAYSELSGSPTIRYQTVQDEGVDLAQEPKVNFIGAGVTCADNAGLSTDCTIPSGGTTHSILSATHTDSTAGVVARGDVITGQGVSPKWVRLPKGSANNVLKMDSSAVDVLWGQVDFSELSSIPQFAQGATCSGTDKFSAYNAGNGLFTCSTDVGANHNLLSATHLDTAVHTVLRGDLIAGIGASPAWTAVAAGGTNTYPKWNASADVIASTLAAAGIGTPTVCTNQAVTGFTLNADAAPVSTCSTITSAFTSGTFSATAHSLLSATHGDTTAAAAVRGDGLFAIGATPTWQRLAHPATTGGYFKWNGTDIVASTGAASGTGACTNQFASTLNADAAPSCTSVSRATESADARGWAFCGTANGATVTVGPVSASTCCSGGLCRQFLVYVMITGYSGGTPVGRLLTANGTISTTALTNSFSVSEGVTAPTTGSGATAIPGLPMAVTLSAIGRMATVYIDGASGSIKTMHAEGVEGTPSVATAPVLFRGASFFSDLGTNLALANFQLSVYDTLATTAVSSRTFNSGTYLAVWGRSTD